MARSLRKGPYIDPSLFKKVLAQVEGQSKGVIKTWSRSSTILPMMEGLTFDVHNGKEFIRVFVIMEMIGHKLGEFAATRKPPRHSDKKS
ncbi:30S ribosomal protein S19 [Candidatus Synchoanobacter obligatus]|uniref:Small ribosomal subunit protein uS19 n=1 Tax=Candidatus Synchoanobacter obligatus TaxID=2919597 RepID=A0ABT1L5M8_9GAMM|nr:30S ribosomal protein S19 [Candidatus Synchoanobacter obligatus]MCP8352490.1 30S ribosomal protein S19 [Candidatus Synchoanobacter obligatus]